MSLLSFFTNPDTILVADASAVINLNATMRIREIIGVLPHKIVVTENACAELDRGTSNGHDDASRLKSLIADGLIDRMAIGEAGIGTYESLIDGTTLRTLDDGEAATIACAVEFSGIALLDERKARGLCRSSFPSLEVVSTAELIAHDEITKALGAEMQRDALFSALKNARMRVPPEHLERVKSIIGILAAASCHSLPKASRGSVQ